VVDAEAAVVTNKDSSIGCQADVALLIGDNARMGVMAKLRRVFAATHIAVRVVWCTHSVLHSVLGFAYIVNQKRTLDQSESEVDMQTDDKSSIWNSIAYMLIFIGKAQSV
jgi:hypothetical protein